MRALSVTISKTTLSLFTLGLPLYWAIVLAAPSGPRLWRPLALGTFLIAATAPIFCAIHAIHLAAAFLWAPGSAVGFAFEVGAYVAVYIAPYIAPLVIAISLCPELRALVFPWETSETGLLRSAPLPAAEKAATQCASAE